MNSSPSPAAPPFHVLVVDDNRNGLAVRAAVLREMDLDVVTMESPREALRLIEERGFHLLVTDYKMPEMDGIELIRLARFSRPEIKVILVSGYVDPLGLTVENTGADEVIAKTSGEVVALVRAVSRLLNCPAARKRPSSSRPPRVPQRTKADYL